MGKLDDVLNENLKPATFDTPGTPPVTPVVEPTPPVTPETPATPVTPTTPETPPVEFNLESFNKHFGKEYKKPEEIKSLFDLPTKITEVESKLTEFEKTKQELADYKKRYEEVGKYIDPKSFFANEKLYQTNLMLKKYPDKDVALMTRISSLDIDKADNFDLLVLNEMLKNPSIEGGEAGAQEMLASKYGVDLTQDRKEWERLARNQIGTDGNQVRSEFKAFQKVDPELPIDVEKVKSDLLARENAKIETKKSEWKPLMDKALSDFKELPIFDQDEKGDLKEIYKYQVEYSEEDKKSIAEDMINYLAYTGQDVNEKSIKNSLDLIKGRYLLSQLPKIMKSYGLQIATQKDEEWHQKVNNDNPLSDKQLPAGDLEKETQNWIGAIKGS
jgi:hypothetical protein